MLAQYIATGIAITYDVQDSLASIHSIGMDAHVRSRSTRRQRIRLATRDD